MISPRTFCVWKELNVTFLESEIFEASYIAICANQLSDLRGFLSTKDSQEKL